MYPSTTLPRCFRSANRRVRPGWNASIVSSQPADTTP